MLELRNITKRFGNVLANDRVNIVVRPGSIHAIVGENGAGKSTAMRIAYGFYRADSGEILVDGKPQPIHTPHDAIALGIGMVHQHFMLVDTMTVAENIVLGAEPGTLISLDIRGAGKRIRSLSEEFHLAIILDEPTAVLTPQEVDEFFQILRRMREQGKTVIIITHKLDEVLAISDEVTVMRDGRVLGHRKTAETTAAELARLMVGREVLLRVQKKPAVPGRVILSVRQLSMKGRLNGISFVIRAGEILGIAGVEGNGQTELIEALAGLAGESELSGSIDFDGREISRLSARQRKELGIAHVPEDRQRRGLLLDASVAENSILGVHYREPAVTGRSGIMLDDASIRARAQRVIEGFDVRPANSELPARALSGGNQQKLIIGREFELPPTSSSTGGGWRRVVDTYLESPNDICETPDGPPVHKSIYRVQPRSVVLLLNRGPERSG